MGKWCVEAGFARFVFWKFSKGVTRPRTFLKNKSLGFFFFFSILTRLWRSMCGVRIFTEQPGAARLTHLSKGHTDGRHITHQTFSRAGAAVSLRSSVPQCSSVNQWAHVEWAWQTPLFNKELVYERSPDRWFANTSNNDMYWAPYQ